MIMKICHKYENSQFNDYSVLCDLLTLQAFAQEEESKLVFFKIFYGLL